LPRHLRIPSPEVYIACIARSVGSVLSHEGPPCWSVPTFLADEQSRNDSRFQLYTKKHILITFYSVVTSYF